MDKVPETKRTHIINGKACEFYKGEMQVEQIFENSHVTGFVVNDANYLPAPEKDFEESESVPLAGGILPLELAKGAR